MIVGEAELRRFDQIRLTEPLTASLKQKQQAMKATLDELRAAPAYGFAEVYLASDHEMGYEIESGR